MSMDLFDLHCDTITVCSSKNLELRRNDLHISLERLPAGSRWGQAFAIFVPDELRGEKAVEFFRENVRFFRAEMEKNADRIVQASDYKEIMQAFDDGKFAAILNCGRRRRSGRTAGNARRAPELRRADAHAHLERGK